MLLLPKKGAVNGAVPQTTYRWPGKGFAEGGIARGCRIGQRLRRFLEIGRSRFLALVKVILYRGALTLRVAKRFLINVIGIAAGELRGR